MTTEPIKHEWVKDEYGEIDFFRYEVGYHNGPSCRRCGATFCEHCEPDRVNEACGVQDEYLDLGVLSDRHQNPI